MLLSNSIYKKTLDYSFLWVFGCLCFPNSWPYTRHKMNFCSSFCVFLGCSKSLNSYQHVDLKTKQICIYYIVYFDESFFLFMLTWLYWVLKIHFFALGIYDVLSGSISPTTMPNYCSSGHADPLTNLSSLDLLSYWGLCILPRVVLVFFWFEVLFVVYLIL